MTIKNVIQDLAKYIIIDDDGVKIILHSIDIRCVNVHNFIYVERIKTYAEIIKKNKTIKGYNVTLNYRTNTEEFKEVKVPVPCGKKVNLITKENIYFENNDITLIYNRIENIWERFNNK